MLAMFLVKHIVWLVAFTIFFAFGIFVNCRVQETGAIEVFGYDYVTFMSQMREPMWITYTGFRHPGLGLVLSPVVVVAGMLAKVSQSASDKFIVIVIAAVGVLNVWLMKKIGGWIAVSLFMTFGFLWVLVAVPESFPFAMTSLLLVVVACCEEVRRKREGLLPLPLLVWGCLFALAGAVTITNCVKVIVAYLICNWEAIKKAECSIGVRKVPGWFALCLCFVIFVVFGALFFLLRMYCWNALHPEAPKSICAALSQTVGWIPRGLGIAGRARDAVVSFIAIPLVPRVSWGDLTQPAPPTLLGVSWCLVLCGCAILSAILNRRQKVIQVMAGMFTIDLVIHVICGWGLNEGWIFCAHWFWMVPILIGQLFNWRNSE